MIAARAQAIAARAEKDVESERKVADRAQAIAARAEKDAECER